jgi:hypothetical protein
MANLKHVGRVVNTDVKCVVVFREIYDDRGNVIDPDNCIVIETERLPDMEHDDVIRVVESRAGQDAREFYEIAHRTRLSDGTNMLSSLHKRGRLRKYPTSQIVLTPNPQTAISLSEVNEIVRKQQGGMSESDVKNTMVDDTDKPPRSETTAQTVHVEPTTTDDILDDTAIAKNMLSQAETFLAEAARLQKEAYEMAPELKPKRTRKSAPKKSTSNADS